MKKEYIPCPICSSEHSKVLYEPWVDVDDPVKLYGAASGIQGTQRLVTCKDCEMIYENPRFPEKVILEGYTSSMEAGHDSQYQMRVNSFYRALKPLSKVIPPKGAKVLDIGTAGGAFLEAAERFGYVAIGLEPSLFLVNEGKRRNLKIEQGTIDNHPFPKESFDMVCLWDVLEHLTDPKNSLLKIRALIKPGGILLINYPDIGTLMAKIAGKRFWWLLSVHLHYFTQETIKKICNYTGFEVFCFQKYWQILEFGYLEDMAIHYKIPLSKFLKRRTPKFIQQIPIPYYASQTTAIARLE
ncbi:MAG: class I SAM-dependent methyltransferase [bacterium]|nr:class I SAM-dependent methyltransferase [bacterium]